MINKLILTAITLPFFLNPSLGYPGEKNKITNIDVLTYSKLGREMYDLKVKAKARDVKTSLITLPMMVRLEQMKKGNNERICMSIGASTSEMLSLSFFLRGGIKSGIYSNREFDAVADGLMNLYLELETACGGSPKFGKYEARESIDSIDDIPGKVEQIENFIDSQILSRFE